MYDTKREVKESESTLVEERDEKVVLRVQKGEGPSPRNDVVGNHSSRNVNKRY